MGVFIQLYNDIRITGYMDAEIYNVFIKKLCYTVEHSDYSNVIKLDEDNQKLTTFINEPFKGNIDDFISWLRLIDVFIFRPNQCYISDQHIMMSESYNDDDPVIISFHTINDNLVTETNHFFQEMMKQSTQSSVIPSALWLSIVCFLTGKTISKYTNLLTENDTDTEDENDTDTEDENDTLCYKENFNSFDEVKPLIINVYQCINEKRSLNVDKDVKYLMKVLFNKN